MPLSKYVANVFSFDLNFLCTYISFAFTTEMCSFLDRIDFYERIFRLLIVLTSCLSFDFGAFLVSRDAVMMICCVKKMTFVFMDVCSS